MDIVERKLYRAIETNNTTTVRSILLDYPQLADPSIQLTRRNVERIGWGDGLIDHEADVNECTPLEIAIDNGNTKWAEILLKNGAKLECVEHQSYDVIDRIFKGKNRKDMLELLMRYGLDTSMKNNNGENLLFQFADRYLTKDDTEAVKIAEILINSGVPVDETENTDLRSPLHNSVIKGHLQLTSYLIGRGADVNRWTKWELNSPVKLAVVWRDYPMVDLLMSKGADIYAKDAFGESVLNLAFDVCDEKMISLFIRRGARDERGRTPFSTLDRRHRNYNKCILAMIKEFCKLSFESVPIPEADMKLIKRRPTLKKYIDKCKEELARMAKTKFYGNYSYYFVLKVSENNLSRLARLTQYRRFVETFEENVDDFVIYSDYLRRTMKEAVPVLEELKIVEARLKFIFGDLLPYLVIREVANSLTPYDLPIE